MKNFIFKRKTVLNVMSLLAAMALVISACGTPTPEPTPELVPTEPPPVEEAPTEAVVEELPEIVQPIAIWNGVSEAGNWVLMGYGDALNPTVVEPDTYVTINFSPIDDAVSGSGGCNQYNSTYMADDQGNLSINMPMGATMMACETGEEQEAFFLGALNTVSGYSLAEDGHLYLKYDSGAVYEEQMTFVRETPLMNTQWVLTGYGDPNNLTPTQAEVMTTAVFSGDGNLNGSGGCNMYSIAYNLQGNQIELSGPPPVTMMECEVGMEQEQAFMGILLNAATYNIGMNALDIVTTDGSNMLRFSAQHLPLENVRWQLASIDGMPVPEDFTGTVLFTPLGIPANQGIENSIAGDAGCNSFIGAYNIMNDTFTAGPFGVTQMMCDEATMQIENAYLSGLENVQNFQITLNQLIINTNSGSLLLYADRMPLEGPQWTLSAIGSVDDPQPPAEGTEFTARFERSSGMISGVKSGGTRCNDYTATYYASMDGIKVNLPQKTNNSCSDAQTEAEQGYFLGLNSARQYRIIGDQLYVYFDNSVLIFSGSYDGYAGNGALSLLDGTQWWLSSIDSFLVVPGTEVTILFSINPDGTTGSITGMGGCNQYSAEITGLFTLSPINATTSACEAPEGVMEQEAAYLNALKTSYALYFDGNNMQIHTAMETLHFVRTGPVAVQPLPPTAVIVAPETGEVDQMITFDGSSSYSEVDITSFFGL